MTEPWLVFNIVLALLVYRSIAIAAVRLLPEVDDGRW